VDAFSRFVDWATADIAACAAAALGWPLGGLLIWSLQ
jgi:hypothetical protein